MTDTWRKVPVIWKAVVVVISCLTIGFTAAAAVLDVPAKINANATLIGSIDTRLLFVEETQRGVLSTQKEILTGIKLGNCLSVASAKGIPYQQCLD